MVKRSYEEFRKQRLEENKKRMEDLNLTKLAHSLKPASASPKPSPMKPPRTPRRNTELLPLRRSTRIVNNPAPVYKEVAVEFLERHRRVYYKRRDLSNRVYASDEARANAIDRAEELQSGLEEGFPSFVKPMLQSHTTGGFWLGLPVPFCRKNLPKRDETVCLVDEDGEEYNTVYLAQKTGLSGGWRGFSLAHKLVDGDALVFQLVKRTQFKVVV
ncbi:hypothetical protein Sjap_017235 [Stephania japonica]|uniref:TF-B3 domain-containing protein n=1 Tax=Stephania japonica TaxID=461633 RepID=A0AAP0I5S8_9MAGN